MKTLLCIALMLPGVVSRAQALDTLFTNEHHNVAIFFPDKIRQAVVGAENYLFSYNQEHPQFFGLLKGSPGKTSNLLSITQNGEIYSYVLAYKEKLPQLLYFLKKEDSKGSERPPIIEDTTFHRFAPSLKNEEQDSITKMHSLHQQAQFFYSTTTGKLKNKRKDGITLQVNKLLYNEGQVYAVFEIANNSGIDFETEYLSLFLVQGNKRRNSSYQKILQQPLLTYKFPDVIKNGERKRFVYVLRKFTVGERERVEVQLREKHGNRLVQMRI
jgi:hypothetical protein